MKIYQLDKELGSVSLTNGKLQLKASGSTQADFEGLINSMRLVLKEDKDGTVVRQTDKELYDSLPLRLRSVVYAVEE